jgi:hypothetical protein
MIADSTGALAQGQGFNDFGFNLLSSIKSIAKTAAGAINVAVGPADAIEYIQIDSQLSPTIRSDYPMRGPSGPSTGGTSWMAIIKPQFQVKVKGMDPIKVAPWGTPTMSYWPVIYLLALAGVGAIGYAGYKLISKK